MKVRHGINKAVVLTRSIKADANGTLPTEIELARAGEWNTPWHGDFKLGTSDFDEAIKHFDAGIYRVQGTEPLPGTLDHDGGAAAFRITRIYRIGDVLWASVTWTKLGEEKLERDEYRYISFEYNTTNQPLENPEKAGEFIPNVLTGGTLTNDPLFKSMKPVMASAGGTRNNNEGEHMNLAELLAKKAEELSDAEKAFLAEHKTELTDEQRTTFGFTEETAEEKTTREAAEARELKDAQDAKAATDKAEADRIAAEEAAEGLKASANGGLSAAQITQLQADAKAGREAQQELLKNRLTASVTAHINRGAIKSDQLTNTVDLLMASTGSIHDKLVTFMDALPANALLAGVKGSGDEGKTVVVTDEEKALAADFGNTPEQIKAYKESLMESK